MYLYTHVLARAGGGGKNYSVKSDEDMEELMQTLVAQIHAKLKSELNLRELYLPNSKAEARCSIFVSHNYAACPKLCVFMQPGEGLFFILIHYFDLFIYYI